MSLDRREPAVYVDIEDASFSTETLETGRITFGVTLCEKGPHNKLEQIQSKALYHKKYGQPNYKRTSNVHYQLDNALNYAPILVCRVVPDGSTLANCQIKETANSTLIQHLYFFTNNSNIVTTTNQSGVDAINIGDWIYAEHDGSIASAQVISKNINDTAAIYELVLANKYEGSTTVDLTSFSTNGCNLFKYVSYIIDSLPSIENELDVPTQSSNIVYNFYAIGAGTYYNNLVIRANRNTEFDKMFMTNERDATVLYPYLFMDIALYEIKVDGSERLIEGPWTVSLIPRTPLNELIRDISSGKFLFIENVINENSDYIRCVVSDGVEKLITHPDAEQRRMQVMSLFCNTEIVSSKLIGSGVGVNFENGSYGPGLYDSGNNYNPSNELLAKVALAYEGTLQSNDGSIEQLQEFVYPYVQPDYIVTGGYPSFVQEKGRFLASLRKDCHHLGDTGFKTKVEDDINARSNEYNWNDWTSSLYPQFRQTFDTYTGNTIWMSPIYHVIDRQLNTDLKYFLAEPVAGIEKGNISQNMTLAYYANHTQRGDMLDKELNFTIKEPDGQYFSTAITTYKRMSVLKNQNVAKFVSFLRKKIPPLLKDILQRKGTSYWIEQGRSRTYSFLSSFLENPSNERYSILKSFEVNLNYNKEREELNVYLKIRPVRTIQRINVFIIVQ